MAGKGEEASRGEEVSLKERFFRYFQHEITALQQQMARLADTALIGGERADAMDHCLAGLARLSGEVKDASSYLPTYDQRTYAEAIKALQEKFNETRATFAPKSRFTFKTARKNPSAMSLNDAAELAAQKRLQFDRSPNLSSRESSLSTTPNYLRTPPNENVHSGAVQSLPPAPPPTAGVLGRHSPDTAHSDEKTSGGLLDPKTAAIRRPFLSTSTSVSVSNQSSAHIILPSTSSQASTPCSLTQLTGCVVDMSVPSNSGTPFAGLTVKNIHQSLLICGKVDGAAHITGASESVMVISSRQFRMHECKDVDVYLSCTSRPIIEDCQGIRFSKIPETYREAPKLPDTKTEDRWDQVDDFKWLKAQHSPNWSILSPEDTVLDDTWSEVVPGGPGWSITDILRASKVLK